MLIHFKDWEFEVDRRITKDVYDAIDKGGAQTCGCNYCLNFLLQQEGIYPPEVVVFFEEVGIDYHKEVEVVEYGEVEKGQYLYNSWFHFAGRIMKGKTSARLLPTGGYQFELTSLTETAKIGFWPNNDLAYFPNGIPLVQVEFEIRLPWKLNAGN
ncbi:hypothetical protein [Siphonobacter curvatus]|uniref:Uncharacterized protein n=1 Tax=Siphonobacter curvatus TaxID=2094562 RepID=A0A2S7II92_9BACT|nr:hypothetical protein [Siphonobacter curvatus]PQA55686.1 hypothetical protein C5O19_19965 [Siphonobacter curvatus]